MDKVVKAKTEVKKNGVTLKAICKRSVGQELWRLSHRIELGKIVLNHCSLQNRQIQLFIEL